MKKLFIVSDVHGFYQKLMDALNKNGYDCKNPNHIFVSCGDLLDRGPSAKECLNFVNELPNENKILIRGNHEDLMEKAIALKFFRPHDVHNRTVHTVVQVTGMDLMDFSDYEILSAMEANESWNKYVNSTVNYAEIGDNIFVHGWIPSKVQYSNDEKYKDLPDYYKPTIDVYNPDWREASDNEWDSARWRNGMAMWADDIYEKGKTIWCGHWHCSWGNSNLHEDGVEFLDEIETFYIDPDTGREEPHVNNNPFKDDGIVALDACTMISNVVNCEVIEVEDELIENFYKNITNN